MFVPAKVTTASVLTSECISPCHRSHPIHLKTDNPHNACARTTSLALPARIDLIAAAGRRHGECARCQL